MLNEDVKNGLNTYFEKNQVPIKLHELVLFRPVMHEPPYDGIEVLSDASRFMACSNFSMVINMTQGDHKYECELHYKISNGKLQNVDAALVYADILPGDDKDLKKFQDTAIEYFKLVGLLVYGYVDSLAKKKEDKA